jgi:hypothetical protein
MGSSEPMEAGTSRDGTLQNMGCKYWQQAANRDNGSPEVKRGVIDQERYEERWTSRQAESWRLIWEMEMICIWWSEKHRTKSRSDERVAVTSTGGEAAMKSLASSEKERSEEARNGWASGEVSVVTGRF